MTKTVTLRLSDEHYLLYKKLAKKANQSIANFINTTVQEYIQSNSLLDEVELEEVRNNTELNESFQQGLIDKNNKKGQFV